MQTKRMTTQGHVNWWRINICLCLKQIVAKKLNLISTKDGDQNISIQIGHFNESFGGVFLEG